jgi:hypothetical protein
VSPTWTDSPATGVTPSQGPPAAPTTASEPKATYPEAGSGAYTVVPGTSAVAGTSGQLMRYQVAIENDITNLDAAAVAAFVEGTYADPRGWTAGGTFRFQRVGPGQVHELTVYLATPGTREKVCADGNDRYTNCRKGDFVVINMNRWEQAVPNYGPSLSDYRHYAINHETGHRLGDGHELCPGNGQPAPVMQQQTLGLHGCVANAWPYVNGSRYRGKSGAYDDPVPS